VARHFVRVIETQTPRFAASPVASPTAIPFPGINLAGNLLSRCRANL